MINWNNVNEWNDSNYCTSLQVSDKKRSFASFDDNPVIVIVSALLQLLPDRIPLEILVNSCALNNLLVSLSLLLLSISTLQSVNVKGH